MKKLQLKKPDIKGKIRKIKNLKKEDVIAYWKADMNDVREYWKQDATVHLQRRCSRSMHS